MKNMFIVLLALATLVLSACSGNGQTDTGATNEMPGSSQHATSFTEFDFIPSTFEESVMRSATDVVVVQYVESRPFGSATIERENLSLLTGYWAMRRTGYLFITNIQMFSYI